MKNSQVKQPLDVLIIGAGFGGVYQLERLREEGFNVHVIEAGAKMGGVWYWNCYPGARTDSNAIIYQFTHKDLWKDWRFSELYPGYNEVQDYFEYLDEKLDLKKDISFNTRVTKADYDTDRKIWTVKTDTGAEIEAQFLLPCVGFGSKPYIPVIKGLDRFKGACHHTAEWPQDGLALDGKRVALIGTGASGIQIVQAGSKVADQLFVFQRTPNTALPMRQRQLDVAAQDELKKDYPAIHASRKDTFTGFGIDFIPKSIFDVSEQERDATLHDLWDKGGFYPWLGTFQDLLFDEKANRIVYDFWRDRVHERVNDPETAEMLAPKEPVHPFGVKRPSLEQDYFDMYNRDNVTLVDLRKSPDVEVTETGVSVGGQNYEVDVIVLATGFDAITGGLTAMDIRGSQGQLLRDKWAEGVAAHLGIATSGFPNMFFVYGPQSPNAFCNGPSCAELQGEWIVQMFKDLRDKGAVEIEAEPGADDEWRNRILEMVSATLIPRADSWYLGANIPGKPREMLSYPGGVPGYLQKLQECSSAGYAGFRTETTDAPDRAMQSKERKHG